MRKEDIPDFGRFDFFLFLAGYKSTGGATCMGPQRPGPSRGGMDLNPACCILPKPRQADKCLCHLSLTPAPAKGMRITVFECIPIYCILYIVYCLLAIVYCLLPIVCCLLYIVYCILSIVYCILSIVYCLLAIDYCLFCRRLAVFSSSPSRACC